MKRDFAEKGVVISRSPHGHYYTERSIYATVPAYSLLHLVGGVRAYHDTRRVQMGPEIGVRYGFGQDAVVDTSAHHVLFSSAFWLQLSASLLLPVALPSVHVEVGVRSTTGKAHIGGGAALFVEYVPRLGPAAGSGLPGVQSIVILGLRVDGDVVFY